ERRDGIAQEGIFDGVRHHACIERREGRDLRLEISGKRHGVERLDACVGPQPLELDLLLLRWPRRLDLRIRSPVQTVFRRSRSRLMTRRLIRPRRGPALASREEQRPAEARGQAMSDLARTPDAELAS